MNDEKSTAAHHRDEALRLLREAMDATPCPPPAEQRNLIAAAQVHAALAQAAVLEHAGNATARKPGHPD